MKQECKDKIQRLRIMKSKNQTIDREVTGTKTRQIQEQELEREQEFAHPWTARLFVREC